MYKRLVAIVGSGGGGWKCPASPFFFGDHKKAGTEKKQLDAAAASSLWIE